MPILHGSDATLDDGAKERKNFSARLQQALRNAQYSPDSPTQLAREFNIRFTGRPITVHAARKWLVGEAIPTQEKMRTLAQWLGVTAEWLRFGGDTAQSAEETTAGGGQQLAPDLVRLVESFKRLDSHHRLVAHEMLRILVHASAKSTSMDEQSSHGSSSDPQERARHS
jgi:hypothetical protein